MPFFAQISNDGGSERVVIDVNIKICLDSYLP